MSKYLAKAVSAILGIMGVLILLSVFIPIVSYEAKVKREYPDLLKPVPESVSLLERSNEQKDKPVLGVEDNVDYTDASKWFPESDKNQDFAPINGITFYTLSIPRLHITNAAVAIGGQDLASSLIQYPGTALPGKNGNSVIFGHSLLPVFYNPENYLSIFSTIDKLKAGDKIIVDYDGILYTYAVSNKFEVRPTDIYILDQDKNGSYLSLVTCSPPGDWRKPKRLVVKAELMK